MTQTCNDAEDFAPMEMTTFLMASAHDMKNSLSVMMAYLEGALRELPSPAGVGASDLTHQALYEAQRLNDHLIRILALYKINEGLYPFDPVDVDLAIFTREVVARVHPLAQAKGIGLDIASSAEACSWYFDHELILSMLVHALHNAIKYTRDRVRLSVNVADSQLHMRVEDNGTGYPPFMLAKGFATRQGIDVRTGSTGLGLYFGSEVARMHRNRGRVGCTWLENGGALGGGCFVLALP